MPVLIRGRWTTSREPAPLRAPGDRDRRAIPSAAGPGHPRAGVRLLEACSNPHCATGWLHLWRSRSTPVFEGGWTCSADCTRDRIQAAVWRELDGHSGSADVYRHRIPLGLVMMEQGWITAQRLKQALEAQRSSGDGRLGDHLVRLGISEHLVARALSLQWSCPLLAVDFHDPHSVASLLPRFFVDAFGALPLRVAAGRLVYLGFEERLDPVLALALERQSGLRVESGVVRGSEFRGALARMLRVPFPRVELLEAASEPALVHALAQAIERAGPVESRLARVHDCLWLRMWNRAEPGTLPDIGSVQDVIASVGA